jgi:tripartite-type tricarboxylate transporter receptor subunit TctC
MVNRGHFLLIVRPGLPATTLQEFVELTRAPSRKVTYGSWGPGSGTHLAMALFERRLKATLVHVPYKGTAPVLNDLMGAHLDAAFETTNPAIHQIRAGKLKAIGVSAPARKDFLPDVPAIAEVFPGFEVATWGGVLTAAGTPKPIIARLNQEISKIVRSPAVTARMSDLGTEPVGSSVEEFTQRIRQDVALWGKVIHDLGLKPE